MRTHQKERIDDRNRKRGRDTDTQMTDGAVGGVDFYDLPRDCVSAIVGFTSPPDACRIEALSKIFRSAAVSDSVWERFLPSDYRLIAARSDEGASLLHDYPSKKQLYLRLADRPLLIDGATKSFGLEKSSGKICCMISAKSLSITWSSTPRYWRWTSMPESRFAEVAELIDVCWLEIRGRIRMSLLSPGTSYAAYLVFKMTEGAYGFFSHAEASVRVLGGKTETRTVYFDSEDERRQRRQIVPWGMGMFNQLGMPIGEQMGMFDWLRSQNGTGEGDIKYSKQRGDGWMEMEIGLFFIDDGEDEVVLEVKHGNWKGGLIVEGIEVRPEPAR